MIVGILGGIGAGKSTVASLLAEAGATVLDADRMAREVIEEPACREEIVRWLGKDVLQPDGTLDRQAIGLRVFQSREALNRLEELIHPGVIRRLEAQVDAHRREPGQGRGREEDLLVLDVPLLISTPLLKHCDALLYVDAPLDVRRARVEKRGWQPGEIESREIHQPSNKEKRRLADFVIDNSRDLEETRRQVEECHARLISRRQDHSKARLSPGRSPEDPGQGGGGQ